MTHPDCHYGDHLYRGTGACVRCGKRLRCYCGAFVTEAGIDKHLETCVAASPVVQEGETPAGGVTR